MTTGRRYGGDDALAAGIVTSAVTEDAVLSTALELARSLSGKAGSTLATIKQRMYAEAIERLARVDGVSLGT
jgi:enoyl-CoA hydratase/carnithine racemase